MQKLLRCFVLALPLCLVLATNTRAGELENKLSEAALFGQVDVLRDLLAKV